MESNINTKNIEIFLDSLSECENISETNKLIAREYIESLQCHIPKLSNATINYNLKIMKLTLENIGNLDDLTVKDLNSFKIALNKWTRVRKGHEGESISDETKKQHYRF